MRIAVAGMGYVGLAVAVLLARLHQVTVADIVPAKVDNLNKGIAPFADAGIEEHLAKGAIELAATLDGEAAYREAELVVIATPTNYDDETGRFDVSSVDQVIDLVAHINPAATVLIKSTVPVGYTQKKAEQHPDLPILFSPEFLREGRALYDQLRPTRIIAGYPVGRPDEEQLKARAKRIVGLFAEAAEAPAPCLVMSATEAEAVKLFSNTFLALRVAFFNELDSYAMANGLDSGQIIRAMGLDPRIGDHYNNPSFGYGGYCLPKDTKQLLSNFADTPQDLLSAVIASNATRKQVVGDALNDRIAHLANELGRVPVVGFYRLAMKSGSDNARAAAMIDVIANTEKSGARRLLCEPMLDGGEAYGCTVENDLSAFKASCDLIVANRMRAELDDVADKVWTRDQFGRD